MKKIWSKTIRFTSFVLVLPALVVAILAYGETAKTRKVDAVTKEQITLGYNLLTLGKFIETNGAFVKDKNDQSWLVPVKKIKAGAPSIEPKYNLVKILDAGLTKKSLNETWPSELKWWATSFTYALSLGLYNQNKIGAGSDWDGKNGQRLGKVAKTLVASVFSKASEKKEFQTWADKFIAHRREAQLGAAGYSKVEKDLAGKFVNKFKQKAILFAGGLIKVWAARWNWTWTTYEAVKLIRFVNYGATKASVKKWVADHRSEVRIPKQTSIAGYADQKALNASTIAHIFKAGWYDEGLFKNHDGSQVSAPINGLTISEISNNRDDSSLQAFTIQGGIFSGSGGLHNANWNKIASSGAKMIYLGKDEANGGMIFVREDIIKKDASLSGTLTQKISSVRRKDNYDKYGKTVV